MNIPIKHTWALPLWLILPICAGVAYPFLRTTPQYIEWLTIGLLIYALFFSVVVHELSHGLAAYFCGDSTARDAGRLTFNPLSHISLVGSILVPLALYFFKAGVVFGWAKPVPFTPIQLKEHPRDQVMVAMAGPLSNFALAYVCFNLYILTGMLFNRIFPESAVFFHLDPFTPQTFHNVPYEAFWFVVFELLGLAVLVNTVLGVFNLIPFPPLDGSWILKALLPQKATILFGKFQLFGFILLLIALQLHLLEVFFYPAMVLLFVFQYVANMCLW